MNVDDGAHGFRSLRYCVCDAHTARPKHGKPVMGSQALGNSDGQEIRLFVFLRLRKAADFSHSSINQPFLRWLVNQSA